MSDPRPFCPRSYPDVPHRGMTRSPGDASARIRNLSTVLKNIKHFYEVSPNTHVGRCHTVALMVHPLCLFW